MCIFKILILAPFLVSSINLNSFNNPKTKNFLTIEKANRNNPNSGFEKAATIEYNCTASEATGYITIDSYLYSMDFTDQSKLFCIYLDTTFVSGWTANKVFNYKNYDWHYDIYSGLVKINLKSKKDVESYSSIVRKGFFPNSSQSNITITSSYSNNYVYDVNNSYGFSLDDLNFKHDKNYSAGLTVSTSLSLSTSEPSISASYGPSPKELETNWAFEYQTLNRPPLRLKPYYLFEVKNDSSLANVDFCFDVDFDINLKCIAWKNYIWQQIRSTNFKKTYSFKF